MPLRRITIPPPIQFTDPETEAPLEGARSTLSFREFMTLLFSNPLWCESIKHGIAQLSITTAYKDAIAKGEGSFVVAGDDWEFLNAAASNPRTMVMTPAGMQTAPGFGYHPSVTAQLVPMMLSITKAPETTEPPPAKPAT